MNMIEKEAREKALKLAVESYGGELRQTKAFMERAEAFFEFLTRDNPKAKGGQDEK